MVVMRPMRFPKWNWHHTLQDRNAQMHGVRILCRASFVLLVVSATIANKADQDARATGLISVRVNAPSMALGTHACMMPTAEDVPDEPEPEKPPCPKSKR